MNFEMHYSNTVSSKQIDFYPVVREMEGNESYQRTNSEISGDEFVEGDIPKKKGSLFSKVVSIFRLKN